jgi:hypothetical protein
MALPVQSIFETLHDAGISIKPSPDGLLLATPASRLTDDLRALIRSHKADLVRWFTSTAANDPEPPEDPGKWRELAAAYHAHHFNCTTCQATGRGTGYSLRCGTGAALWIDYQNN